MLGLGFTCLFIIFIYFLFGDKKFEKSELESWHEVLALMLVFIIYVAVNFLFQLIFIFPLFWGMVMYANEFKTKEKQKLTEIKN